MTTIRRGREAGWRLAFLLAGAASLLAAGALGSCQREVLLGRQEQFPDLGAPPDAALPPDLAMPRVAFRAPVPVAVASDPRFIQSGDVDEDGHLDLIVAHGMDRAVYTLLGRGDGTFQSARITACSDVAEGLLISDFDKDKHLDLAVLYPGSKQVQIFAGGGDGTFSAVRSYPTDIGSLASADFNRDGRPDLAVASSAAVAIVLSGPLGVGFEPLTPQSYRLPGPAAALAAGDLNGDQFPDLVVAMATDPALHVFLNSGGTSFREHVDPLLEPSQNIGLLQLAGAGALSGVVTTPAAVLLLDTQGGVIRGDAKFPSLFAVGKNPRLLDGADVDRDGRLDLITASSSDSALSVLFGTGLGDFERTGATLPLGASPRSFAIGDWNEDRISDLAVATDAPRVQIHFGRSLQGP